jgi:ElaB/YqjD/DUF883 family membrane-anchored ribosome-binding protein
MDQRYLKSAASNVQDIASSRYRQATSAIGGYVRESPWKAVGIAAAVGALIGYFTARR